MNKELKSSQIKFLRASAHTLKPVIIVGNGGLHDNVMRELELSLDHHELIKIKLNAENHDDRAQMIKNICNHTGAALIQKIGHVAVIYKQSKEKKIQLPT